MKNFCVNIIYPKMDLVLMITIKNITNSKNHCHYTRKYRGAAHDICNFRYQTPKEIPVYFIMVLHTIINL